MTDTTNTNNTTEGAASAIRSDDEGVHVEPKQETVGEVLVANNEPEVGAADDPDNAAAAADDQSEDLDDILANMGECLLFYS